MSSSERIETLVADLENGEPWPLPADRTFGAVIVTNYLHRPLFRHLIDAVAPGGVLVYETFAVGNESVGSRRIRHSCFGRASCSPRCASAPTKTAFSKRRVLPSCSGFVRCESRTRASTLAKSRSRLVTRLRVRTVTY